MTVTPPSHLLVMPASDLSSTTVPTRPRLQVEVLAALVGAGWFYEEEYQEGMWFTYVRALPNLPGRILVTQVTGARRNVILNLGFGIVPTLMTRGETALLLSWLTTIVHNTALAIGRSDDQVRVQATLDETFGATVDVAAIDRILGDLLRAEAHFGPSIRNVAVGRWDAEQGMRAVAASCGIEPFPGR